MILLDANVLVYALDETAPSHSDCRGVVEASRAGHLPGVLVPQVLLETYAIISDGRRVASPLPPDRAWEQIDVLRTSLRVLPWPEGFLTLVGQLILTGPVRAQKTFDVALVAQMRGHGLDRICTLNRRDFLGFSGIVPLSPAELLGS